MSAIKDAPGWVSHAVLKTVFFFFFLKKPESIWIQSQDTVPANPFHYVGIFTISQSIRAKPWFWLKLPATYTDYTTMSTQSPARSLYLFKLINSTYSKFRQGMTLINRSTLSHAWQPWSELKRQIWEVKRFLSVDPQNKQKSPSWSIHFPLRSPSRKAREWSF